MFTYIATLVMMILVTYMTTGKPAVAIVSGFVNTVLLLTLYNVITIVAGVE